MKAKMLKLAGVKSEKEFYKKFPTEEAFMKVHGKEFKKAFAGETLPGSYNDELREWESYNDPSQFISNKSKSGLMKAIGKIVPGAEDFTSAANKIAPYAGKLAEGINLIGSQKKALKSAEQMKALSDLTLQASRLKPEQKERRYLRPEDNVNTGEEFFPIYGVGTNVLAKNGTEIANTFAPNTLYDDLGYEPLYDSERVKQFFTGGKMQTAKFGDFLSSLESSGFGDKASQLITTFGGQSAGNTLGGTAGKIAGTAIGGPVGGMIGQIGGQLLGGIFDKTPGKIKKAQAATDKNIINAALNQGFRGAQQQYTSFMEDGGNVNPQIISKFGDYSLEELLTADPTMDTLRAGGHLKEYTSPSARALQTYEEGGYIPEMEVGGELQTHWGGYAEPISRNPYLPDSGETIMFRGQSHDEADGQGNTGIGITYGQSPVEVERGEPAVKLEDGGNSESLVVFGNLKVPNSFVPILGEEAKGKKFKNYVADLSKKENKQNKIIDKSSKGLDELDMNTPFDKLTMGSYKANILGANMKLKDIAEKKTDASALQSAMNNLIELSGTEADDNGIIKADRGTRLTALDKQVTQKQKGKYYGDVTADQVEEMKRNNPWYDFKGFDPSNKKSVERFQKAWNKKAQETGSPIQLEVDGQIGKQTASARTVNREMAETIPTRKTPLFDPSKMSFKDPIAKVVTPVESAKGVDKEKGVSLFDVINQVTPYFRPSNAGRLDPMETIGEQYALSQNQLEPVQAQLFQPELNVPYDISLQDILNENQADFRSQQRMVGYNPAVQGMLNAQKYAANQKVLGEQFRMNQAQKQQIYDQNRAALNQAKLQNLGILDTQYQRQAAAKSATKATTQAALNSIASKYAQNKLANKTLQTYENLYNFRFDPQMRAISMNPLVDFQAMIDNAKGTIGKSTPETKETVKKKSNESRNGSIVKAIKNL